MPKKQKRPTTFKFKPFSDQQRRLIHWWRPVVKASQNNYVIADGSIRSGKTIACIIGFLLWSQEMHSGQSFIVAGKTMGALKKNVIRPMLQILEAWGWAYEYIRSGSEPHISIGSNTYYLFGANTEAAQDSLQGLTAAGAYLDEAALFPKSFVDQAVARCSVDGWKFWMNCNPEGPHHFIKEESMATGQYLSLFYPFDQLDVVKKGIESTWNVSRDRTMIALTMTFMDEPMAKNMSFQREYAEPYDWVAQQFKDWAFTLSTSILYYNDYDSIDEDARGLYRKAMAAFGGIAPSYHIELLDKPTIYWDFHSLLLGIQMMFSFMLVDDDQPLRLCKHCQKVFLGSRSNAAFCSPRCKNQYNVYKSREKSKGEAD